MKKKSLAEHNVTPRYFPHRWHVHVNFPIAALLIGTWLCLGVLTGAFLLYAGNQHGQVATEAKNAITIKIRDVSYDAVGISPFLPGTDRKFAIVNIEVKNGSKDVFHLAPVLQTGLIDGQGHHYGMSPDPVKTPLEAGELKPNEIRQGQLTYSVPVSAKDLVFYFDAPDWPAIYFEYPIK